MDHYLHVLFTQNIILTSEMDHYLHVLFTQNIILTSEMYHASLST